MTRGYQTAGVDADFLQGDDALGAGGAADVGIEQDVEAASHGDDEVSPVAQGYGRKEAIDHSMGQAGRHGVTDKAS